MAETKTLNVRVPDGLLDTLESLVDKGIYSSKSEAIRDFTREFLEEHRER